MAPVHMSQPKGCSTRLELRRIRPGHAPRAGAGLVPALGFRVEDLGFRV